MIDGKQWYWCSPETGGKCAGALRRHKPQDCKGTSKSATEKRKRSKEGDEDQNKQLKIRAKETILEGQGDITDDKLSSHSDGM